MMSKEFFPPRPDSHPKIYAYSDNNSQYIGLLKVGYTEKDVIKRVAQQYPTKRPDGKVPYEIVFVDSAMRNDGSCFTDHDVHKILKKNGIQNVGGEWFKCTINDIKSAVVALQTNSLNIENRTQIFEMRPEQQEAVNKTIHYYLSAKKDTPNIAPKFLWNAKMRFGKTFAAYQLAKKLKLTKVLVLTFKPAVEAAWDEDLTSHVDFEGWQFISRGGLTYEEADKSRPIVCFGSFQDYLGTNEKGGIKAKNEWVHTTNWDIVIFDEYHFGAWRENAKSLFEQPNEDEDFDFDLENYKLKEADNAYNETFLPITSSYYLFLSGTPFRAINSGEFIEEQIYNWTYSDEQQAKENWSGDEDNPYQSLPRMVMLTYRVPESIRQVAMQGEFNEFDLNVFFSAKGKGKEAKFVYENEVQKWLDLICGAHLPSNVDDMKLGKDKRPPMPFSDTRLLNVLSHTFWFLPNVASCYAMGNLLRQRQNIFFNDYNINIAAGTSAGTGIDALAPVIASMGDPLKTKTITLSCGKLTTGVTVKPWTGIFMLRNLKSPETYFQAAFRVQSPWEIITSAGTKEIMKHECYVFDFALDRALKQISDYSCRLNIDESNPEKKVADFINFLPVLAYDGSSMRQINAQDILDMALAGTSATLLAKRWESALLVNVDNETLARLMSNKDAMEALMRIEGFRNLNSDIETIINKSEAVKKVKKEGDGTLTPKEKKELSEEEKEYKSIRKQIQEKLIKFATRVPVFMYLTDYRERSLKDVITQLEPGLFKKVTGLDVKDFELLVSLNVFNGALMNDAIFKFKRYEDASLSYTGINKHEGEAVGGWDTVIKRAEYEALFYNQQATLEAPPIDQNDVPDEIETVIVDNNFDGDNDKVDKPLESIKTNLNKKPGVKKDQSALFNTKVFVSTQNPKMNTPAEEKVSSVRLANLKVGSLVNHNAFGSGTIAEIKNGYVVVSFGTATKKFMFPHAFNNGFLSIE
jgi:hypothetical protein